MTIPSGLQHQAVPAKEPDLLKMLGPEVRLDAKTARL